MKKIKYFIFNNGIIYNYLKSKNIPKIDNKKNINIIFDYNNNPLIQKILVLFIINKYIKYYR